MGNGELGGKCKAGEEMEEGEEVISFYKTFLGDKERKTEVSRGRSKDCKEGFEASISEAGRKGMSLMGKR